MVLVRRPDENTFDYVHVYSRPHSVVCLPLAYVVGRSARSPAFRRCANRAFQHRLTPALDPIVTRRMDVVQVSMVGIYHQGIVCIQKYGGKHTLRRSRSMKVKVVQLSEPHVMRVPNFPTPERARKTTSNEVKARGLKEKHASSYHTQSHRISPSHHVATPSHML